MTPRAADTPSLIDWFTGILDSLTEYGPELEYIRREPSFVLAELRYTVHLTETRLAIETYVTLCLDGNLWRPTVKDIESLIFFYRFRYGTLGISFFSNVRPDETLASYLHEAQVQFVYVQGMAELRPEVVRGYEALLTNSLRLHTFAKGLRDLQIDRERIIHDDTDITLRAYYQILALLATHENEFLYGVTNRTGLSYSTTNVRWSFLDGHAIYSHPAGESFVDCYLSKRGYLDEALDTASRSYQTLLHLEARPETRSTQHLLIETAFQFIQYYVAWLSSAIAEFDQTKLRSHIDALRQLEHIRVVSGALDSMEPLDQITCLQLLGLFEATGAVGDIVRALPRCNRRVQEECLRTLARLKGPSEISAIEDYLFSGAESIQNAALMLVGAIGGQQSASALVRGAKERGLLPSPVFLEALGKTRSVIALEYVLQLATDSTVGIETFLAAERLSNEIDPQELKGLVSNPEDRSRWLDRCEQLHQSQEARARECSLNILSGLGLFEGMHSVVMLGLRDNRIRVRIAAIEAAASLGGVPAVSLIEESVREKPDNYEVAMMAEFLASATQHGKTEEHTLTTSDFSIESAAIKALSRLQGQDATSAMARIQASTGHSNRFRQTTSPVRVDDAARRSIATKALRELQVYVAPRGMTLWVGAS